MRRAARRYSPTGAVLGAAAGPATPVGFVDLLILAGDGLPTTSRSAVRCGISYGGDLLRRRRQGRGFGLDRAPVRRRCWRGRTTGGLRRSAIRRRALAASAGVWTVFDHVRRRSWFACRARAQRTGLPRRGRHLFSSPWFFRRAGEGAGWPEASPPGGLDRTAAASSWSSVVKELTTACSGPVFDGGGGDACAAPPEQPRGQTRWTAAPSAGGRACRNSVCFRRIARRRLPASMRQLPRSSDAAPATRAMWTISQRLPWGARRNCRRRARPVRPSDGWLRGLSRLGDVRQESDRGSDASLFSFQVALLVGRSAAPRRITRSTIGPKVLGPRDGLAQRASPGETS